MTLKLYIVVRSDLPDGAKAAQSAHALAQLAIEHPAEFYDWDNQTIVLLETKGQKTIRALAELAEDGGFSHAVFRETDPASVGYSSYGWDLVKGSMLTAIAFAPNWLVQNVLVTDLPLALSKKDQPDESAKDKEPEALPTRNETRSPWRWLWG